MLRHKREDPEYVEKLRQYDRDKYIPYIDKTEEEKLSLSVAVNKAALKKKSNSPRYDNFYRKSNNARVHKMYGDSRVCSRCGKETGSTAFDIKGNVNKKVRKSYCMFCRQKMNNEYYQKNKEKWKDINDPDRISRRKTVQTTN